METFRKLNLFMLIIGRRTFFSICLYQKFARSMSMNEKLLK